jgi:hypothetical protein
MRNNNRRNVEIVLDVTLFSGRREKLTMLLFPSMEKVVQVSKTA